MWLANLVKHFILSVLFVLMCSVLALAAAEPSTREKKVVLLAGEASHGTGEHEHDADLRLLKYCLDTSPNLKGIKTELHLDGWPKDPSTFDDADTIVLFSDGADYDEETHPFLVGNRMKVVEKQMKRGCGLVLHHYSTIVPRRFGDKWLEWAGGYFDYESGPPPKNWYSRIKWVTSCPQLATPQHHISRGIRPFVVNEEYYYNLRFPENHPGWAPIWTTTIPGESQPQVVAWAIQRRDGGRGFGTTVGHTHANLLLPGFRKMHLNAIIWTAGMEIPAGGVESKLPIKADWMTKRKPQTWDEDEEEFINIKPIKALIITGHDHTAHEWRETSVALRHILWQDRRVLVDVTHEPEMMTTFDLSPYDVLILNYCNWERPGLSDAAKQNLVSYLSNGGGLTIIHCACAAFHFSLPGAEQSDWPEYRKICPRVWDFSSDSGHDEYGLFSVNIVNHKHPITREMKSFETIDELYFNLKGELPIDVLAVARSEETGRDEPMIWIYNYKKARVFQTVLGHSDESLRVPYVSELIRRGCIWAAGR